MIEKIIFSDGNIYDCKLRPSMQNLSLENIKEIMTLLKNLDRCKK